MKKTLEDCYARLLCECNIDSRFTAQNINKIIKEALRNFIKNCNVSAIWCYGKHTKMLMTDFMYEMKEVRYVIDSAYSQKEETGFCIIREDSIEKQGIDGIIISSFKFREEIKRNIEEQHSGIKYLDIYEELAKQGINLNFEYFSQTHPYSHYCNINILKTRIQESQTKEEKEKWYQGLIQECVIIKDFRLALEYIEEAHDEFGAELFSKPCSILKELILLQKGAIARISQKNVLMLCIDGLRRNDILNEQMPKVKEWIKKEAFFYNNAYAVSTSTFESLIPAYSENDDLRTRYYDNNIIAENNCRFVKEAIKQNRKIYFYTDSIAFVESEYINVIDKNQTVTEKIWNFILDAVEEERGLFYIHILYESHFSYANPYTNEKLVADGTNIMFDYLAVNGGKLRTDYDKQHQDALRYLDDVLSPFLQNLKCRMVIYADHGNIILTDIADIIGIERTKFSYDDDLIQVPLIIRSPETGIGECACIESIMSLNAIIISLMKEVPVLLEEKAYVKVLRSEIYNPDFKFLYRKCGMERELLAFEVFVFLDGKKLVIYSNKQTELYDSDGVPRNTDPKELELLIGKVKDRITVC